MRTKFRTAIVVGMSCILAIMVFVTQNSWHRSQFRHQEKVSLRSSRFFHPKPLRYAARPVNRSDADFAAALNEVLQDANPQNRLIAFGPLFRQWCNQDSDAALAFLQQMDRGNEFTQGFVV